jgi:hypothetical protein
MLLLSYKALRWVAICGAAIIIVVIGVFKGVGFITGLTVAKGNTYIPPPAPY